MEALIGISARSEPTSHAVWKFVGSQTETLHPVEMDLERSVRWF